MAIVYRETYKDDYPHNELISDECWFCYESLWPEFELGAEYTKHNEDAHYCVMWNAGDAPIYLHPECAMHLSTRLIRDVVEGGRIISQKHYKMRETNGKANNTP